jgi:hypothetical protein
MGRIRVALRFSVVGVAGIALGLWFGLRSTRTPAVHPKRLPTSETKEQQSDSPLVERTRAIEEAAPQPLVSPSASGAATTEQHSETPEEGRARAERERDALAQRFADELPDPQWSPAAERSLEVDLEKVAKRYSFAIDSVGCKTSMCSAEGRWSSYPAAVNTFRHLLHARTSLACSTQILLPEPANAEDEYTAKLYLDCEQSRIAGTN